MADTDMAPLFVDVEDAAALADEAEDADMLLMLLIALEALDIEDFAEETDEAIELETDDATELGAVDVADVEPGAETAIVPELLRQEELVPAIMVTSCE